MNIFREKNSLLGDFNLSLPASSFQNAFKLAKEMKVKLGVKAYLLENYLSCILTAANIRLAYSTADEGFQRGMNLRGICYSAMKIKDSEEQHPFYARAEEFISQHPLSYQETQTCCCLYYISLADEYLANILPPYLEQHNRLLSSQMDTVLISHLYNEIVEILGNDTQMGQLNLMLRQQFLTAPVISAFVQGFANDLLYCLNQRDNETSKQIFQLYLDEMIE